MNKRYLYLCIPIWLIYAAQPFLSAQPVPLTFKVDMTNEVISENGVHVAGNFQQAAGFGQDWNPGGTQLNDPDADGIYSITVMVPPGDYLYKFVNGNSWQEKPELPSSECAVSDGNSNFNREISVGTLGVSLPPIPFDSCYATLYLAVNMSDESISPEGVHVMGDFQAAAGYPADWDSGATPMTDQNADGTFEVILSVPPGSYRYVFVNGDTPEDRENPPLDCAEEGDDGVMYRTVVAGFDEAAPETRCFNTCKKCDPAVYTQYETFWWNNAVFYEIFVRSFYDSDGDGIGDFRGIIEKLDYLNDGDPATDTDLGVTGIWLMPMMESPTYHGYDVTNYYRTEPDYGTMADFEALLDACHDRGIRVIIDFVMNHTSNQHPWFVQSANNQGDFRDWYIWSDDDPGGTGPWGQQIWHQRNGDYYYGIFWSGMPDLNYSYPPVRQEIFNAARFWLEKGVDGFRLDAIKYLDEDGNVLENTPETFIILEEFHNLYKSQNPESMTVGEVWSNTASILPYVSGNRIDFCFEFDLAFTIMDAVNENNPSRIRDHVRLIRDSYRKLQYAPFLTNHDIDRVYGTLGRIPDKMKQAAAIYLTLPGVPFIYYGEEIGMTGSGIHENIRRPMQWDTSAHAGFSTSSPWYGLGDNYLTNNVAMMEGDTTSILKHYKELIHLRQEFAPLTKGYLLDLQAQQPAFLTYARVHEDEAAIVISNFGGIPSVPEISMSVSSLAPGTYRVFEEFSQTDLGTIALDENGGFTDWKPSPAPLDPRESLLLTLRPQSPVSVNRPEESEWQVRIYPNPASGVLYLQSPEALRDDTEILLYSPDGRLAGKVNMDRETNQLDLSAHKPGFYFVRLQSAGKSTVLPLVIE